MLKQIQTVIFDGVDENDKQFIEELVLHMKGFVSDTKEKFLNFELQQDHDRYILSAQVQGDELSVDELNSIQAVSRNNVSVMFNNSKVFIKVFVLRGKLKNTAGINLKVFRMRVSRCM